MVIGDLELAVLALRRTEKRGAYAGSCMRLALRDERGPQRSARAIAPTHATLIRDEVVQRNSLAVDEDASDPRLRDRNGRSAALGAVCEGNRGDGRREGCRYSASSEHSDPSLQGNLLVRDDRSEESVGSVVQAGGEKQRVR